MGQRQFRGALVAAGLTVVVPTGASQSQELDGGVQLTLDIGTSLTAHSNINLDPTDPGATTRAQTGLTFGLTSETRTQSLAATLGTSYRIEDGPGGTTNEFTDPVFSLAYSRDMARSRFAFNASYTQSDVDGFTQVFDPDLGTTALIIDSGTRVNYELGTSLAFGTEGPLGVTLTLGDRGVQYSETTSAALFDQRTLSASLETDLSFSDVLTGTASISGSHFEAEDATQTTRDTTALSFGFVYTPDARTTFSTDIGGRRIDDSVSGVTEAAEASVSVTRALPRGTISARLSRELTIGGQRNDFEITRSFEFPTGALELTAGVVDAEGADLQPTASLTYSQDLPRGEITASVSTDVSVDSDANVQQAFLAALDYTYAIDSRSQLSLGLDFVDINDISSSGLVERQRGSLSATYTRELAQDWDLSLGAERRYLDQAGTLTWDNSVSVGLNRSFAFRP